MIALKFTQVMFILAACFLETVQGRYLIAQLGLRGAQRWKTSLPGSLSTGSVRPLGILSRLSYESGEVIPRA